MDSCQCSRREALEFLTSKPTHFAAAVQFALFSQTSLRNIIDASVENFIARGLEHLVDTLVSPFPDMLSENVTKPLASITRPSQKTVVDVLPHDEDIPSTLLTPSSVRQVQL